MMKPLFANSRHLQQYPLNFEQLTSNPIKIAAIDILRIKRGRRGISIPIIYSRADQDLYFIRSQSTDGVVGISVAHEKIKYFYPILQQLIIPYFIGKDIRNIVTLIDEVHRFRSNYKLSGLALSCCIAWVEMSLLDLFGKQVEKPIANLLGGTISERIPIYLSSLRRDTTPEAEVDWIGQRLDETGASAVKFKIGGRMSQDVDAMPQRTEKLVAQARQIFGENIAIGVDGNGSFSIERAITVGKFLESHGIAFFEEPCPFDDCAATEQVTKRLNLTIAGGEQETSFARFQQIINRRVVNVLQPDLVYNGGFIRTFRVAQAAAQAQMPVTIHNARLGFDPIYMAQFASLLPGVVQEYNARPDRPPTWFSPALTVKDGMLQVPQGPGLGVEVDPAFLRKARQLNTYKI